MKRNLAQTSPVDLPSLVTELHLRGFDQDKIDAALRCLVHVYAVQGSASGEGGILAEDILNSYDLEVVQVATELFLEKSMVEGKEVLRVRWGCEESAKTMERELWNHASHRWEEFVSQLDGRYLGFFLPGPGEGGRVVTDWKLNRELKWYSVEVPRQGWKILGMMDDVTEVAWKLDLAFGYRPFGPEGVQGLRVLLHERAYELLASKSEPLPPDLIRSIRLWRFFSEYDVSSTDFVSLMKECELALEEVVEQVRAFFELGLTSQYRDGQYPPFFVNDKKRKEFQAAVQDLLHPVDSWLSRVEGVQAPAPEAAPQASGNIPFPG